MNGDIRVRTVTLELLRAGPPHNQLLSPLTQYLGLCGDSGAGIVTLPYEHRTFERRLEHLRYQGEALEMEDAERSALLRDTGVDIAKILGSVPGLPGTLTHELDRGDTLIHLRLVLSASELALLPFELSKVPVGPDISGENWLALQTRSPVCITRHIRTVSSVGVRLSPRPRILFVGGAPDIPFGNHRQLLLESIDPFMYPNEGGLGPVLSEDGRREQFGDLLTILKQATYAEVEEECDASEYTHVHILAHGAEDRSADGTSFGLALKGKNDELDVVSGERFVSALCTLASGRNHRPDVVTVASCDSGNIGSVTTPGASFAHTLHQAGIPLVVASQFPLSKEGSSSVARTLYRGLLWGISPWRLMQQVRSELHGRYATRSHDWASLVVYEALPANLEEQLLEMRYRQSKRAIKAAQAHIDAAVKEQRAIQATVDAALPIRPEPSENEHDKHRDLLARVEGARRRLPTDSAYAMECLGLRASSFKRQAETEFRQAMNRGEIAGDHLDECFELLERSLLDYRRAVKGFMVYEGESRFRYATLHWVMVQMLSLSTVLGKEIEEEYWMTAKLSAEMYLDHRQVKERAWAHGSLAELWLLRLAEGGGLQPEERSEFAEQAKKSAGEIVRLYPGKRDFAVISTVRQFTRYVEWWGHEAFEERIANVGGTRQSWQVDNGVLDIARKLMAILEQRSWKASSGGGEPPAGRHPARQLSAPANGAAAPLMAKYESAPAVPAETPRRVASPKLPRAENAAPAKEHSGACFSVEMLPAGHGDCLWIEYGDPAKASRVLIDCGTTGTYKRLRARVGKLPEKGRRFDLFVLTHVDADHIGGTIPFFNKGRDLGVELADLWFNGYKHLPSALLGAKQGEIFSTLVEDRNLSWNDWCDGGRIVLPDGELPLPSCTLPGGMKLTLLAPTMGKLEKLQVRWEKELRRHGLTPDSRRDYRRFLKGVPSTSDDVDELADAAFRSDRGAPNGSSIGFLAEFEGKSALLVGDAHSPQLADSIRRLLTERGEDKLRVDAFKVSHHASRNNLHSELLQLIDCDRYLISTNGSHFNHPDREAVARVIKYGGADPCLCFNYRTKLNDVWARKDLQEKYGYTALYPAEDRSWFRAEKTGEWEGIQITL